MIFDILNVLSLGFLGDIDDAILSGNKKAAHDDYLKCKSLGMTEEETREFINSKYGLE